MWIDTGGKIINLDHIKQVGMFAGDPGAKIKLFYELTPEPIAFDIGFKTVDDAYKFYVTILEAMGEDVITVPETTK